MARELPPRSTRGQKREATPPKPKTEPPPKKRAVSGRHSTAKTPKAAPVEIQDTPKKETVVVLPTKLSDGGALPALRESQAKTLSDVDYQSVAESGVLAASLARSRHKWLHEGLFEKFWSKSTYKRKKDMSEEEWIKHKSQPKTPAAERSKPSMSKVGNAKVIIEPHCFDVTLFVVKDPTPQQVQQMPNSHQMFVQYGPSYPQPSSPSPAYNNAPNKTPSHQIHVAASNSPTMQAQSHGSSSFRPPAQAPAQQAPSQSQPPHPRQNGPAAGGQPGTSRPNPPPRSSHSSSQTSNAANKPDPVIAMLAERAQKDSALKDIMQIVARGAATPEQLQFFQKHINEITKIVEARKVQEEAAAKAQLAAIQPAASSTPSQPASQTQAPPAVGSPMPGQSSQKSPADGDFYSYPPHPQNQHQHQQQQQQQQQRQVTAQQVPAPRYAPTPPVPRSQPARPAGAAPLHVLLEFASNSVDRFLFPRNSILEFLPGFRACFCSFLVVRKGGSGQAADPALYPAKDEDGNETEYYQPVTIKISADDSNVLSVLARVVPPQDEVRKSMLDVMGRAKRAENSFLALRLPRKKGTEEIGA